MIGMFFGGEGETPGKKKWNAEKDIPEMPPADPTGETERNVALEVENIEKREMGALIVTGWRVPPCSSLDIDCL